MIDLICWICKRKKPIKDTSVVLSGSCSGAKIRTNICHGCMNKIGSEIAINLIDERLTELDKIYVLSKNE